MSKTFISLPLDFCPKISKGGPRPLRDPSPERAAGGSFSNPNTAVPQTKATRLQCRQNRPASSALPLTTCAALKSLPVLKLYFSVRP